jgi:hypothetical protein
MNTAIIKEINKEYIEAVECYEKDLKKFPSIESYINLAFLYWSFAFELFEFNQPNNISENWSIVGGNKYLKTLELGLNNYPNSLELNFWKRYFSHVSFGNDFSESDCKNLIEKYELDKSIVPYFYLFLFDKDKYGEKRNELLASCDEVPIAKNLYIKSIIG